MGIMLQPGGDKPHPYIPLQIIKPRAANLRLYLKTPHVPFPKKKIKSVQEDLLISYDMMILR